VQQNADTIASLLTDVSAALHAVNPQIATGLMTAGPGDVYSGAELPRWMTALQATKLRPGGGFYNRLDTDADGRQSSRRWTRGARLGSQARSQ